MIRPSENTDRKKGSRAFFTHIFAQFMPPICLRKYTFSQTFSHKTSIGLLNNIKD